MYVIFAERYSGDLRIFQRMCDYRRLPVPILEVDRIPEGLDLPCIVEEDGDHQILVGVPAIQRVLDGLTRPDGRVYGRVVLRPV